MKRTLSLAAICGVIGVVIGLPMGVVGYGSGWGGAFIFGPLGLIIGGLIGLALRKR